MIYCMYFQLYFNDVNQCSDLSYVYIYLNYRFIIMHRPIHHSIHHCLAWEKMVQRSPSVLWKFRIMMVIVQEWQGSSRCSILLPRSGVVSDSRHILYLSAFYGAYLGAAWPRSCHWTSYNWLPLVCTPMDSIHTGLGQRGLCRAQCDIIMIQTWYQRTTPQCTQQSHRSGKSLYYSIHSALQQRKKK